MSTCVWIPKTLSSSKYAKSYQPLKNRVIYFFFVELSKIMLAHDQNQRAVSCPKPGRCMRALSTLGLLLCAGSPASQKAEAEGAGQGFYTYTRCEEHITGEAVPPPAQTLLQPPFPNFFTSVVRPEVVKNSSLEGGPKWTRFIGKLINAAPLS